jgi:hypothetical protein
MDQQDAFGVPVEDHRQGMLNGSRVVPGAAAGHQEPERLAHACSPPMPAARVLGRVPAQIRPVTTCTVQGMARVRSGQAPAWPLSSDRSVRRDSGVKYDFA